MVKKAFNWIWERVDKIVRPLSYLLFAIAFGGELWLVFGSTEAVQDRYLLPMTILLSAFMATCGWLWSGGINRRLSRKNNAITLLLFIRSDEINNWKRLVYNYIESSEEDPPEPVEAIMKLLGLYEFVSICVMNGTAEEDMIEQSQRYVFLKFYNGLEKQINAAIKTETDMYCHFIHYTKHWNKDHFQNEPTLIAKEREF